jgi:outer membrane protein assembly factor BamB
MRFALSLLGILAWLLLLPAPACSEPYAFTNEWTVDLESASYSPPAVGKDGTIYVGTWRGLLWALNPDGSRKWRFRANNEIRSAPAVGSDGTVYFGCRDRKLYAVRANGQKQWEFLTQGWVDSSPALAHDGTVYFGSWDKSFYALNADGTKRWQFTTAGEIDSSPAIGTDGTIYFGSHDRKFYALAPDGRKKWEYATGGPIISSPALNKDQCVYFTSVDGCLYAFKLDGSLRWRLRTGDVTPTSPVIGAEGTIYVGFQQHLWAVNPDGTKKSGRTDGDAFGRDINPVLLEGGTMLYWWMEALWTWNAEQGPLLRYTVSNYVSPAVGPTGTLYVPDPNKERGCGFSALHNNLPLARAPWPRFRGNSQNTGNVLDGEIDAGR